jgi:Protein of unknown function (DUF3551)
MSKSPILCLAVAGFALAACSTGAPPLADNQAHAALQDSAETEGQYPWCADFMLDLGTNCGFDSLEQCRAAIGGVGGQCYPNPYRGVSTPTPRPAR